jgi:hypothetical protein
LIEDDKYNSRSQSVNNNNKSGGGGGGGVKLSILPGTTPPTHGHSRSLGQAADFTVHHPQRIETRRQTSLVITF